MPLRAGQKAPDFDVVSSNGEKLRLADFIGKKNVVLFFYPGDFTPVCTKETCGFRDAYADMASKDTEIIGISVDTNETHRRFATEYKVPFALVSDAERTFAKSYGATSILGNILGRAGRVTYVIDKKGEIAAVFAAELSSKVHVEGVKSFVAKLTA